MGSFVVLDPTLDFFQSAPLVYRTCRIHIELQLSWYLRIRCYTYPVQSTSSNHAWRVARSFSVMPVISFGISNRRCIVPLPPRSPSRVNRGTDLFVLSVSLMRLSIDIDSCPAFRSALADFQNTSSPRNKSSHCAASSSRHACSLGCSRLPPTLTILAFNFRDDLAIWTIYCVAPHSIARAPSRHRAY